jgi:hypothetical protein
MFERKRTARSQVASSLSLSLSLSRESDKVKSSQERIALPREREDERGEERRGEQTSKSSVMTEHRTDAGPVAGTSFV